MKTRFAAIAVLGALPVCLAAERVDITLICTFTTECITGETCADTDFEMELRLEEVAATVGPKVVRGAFSTVAEGWDVTGFYDGGTLAVHGGGVFPASHLITVSNDQKAIYTNHISSDFGITYLGECR